MTLAADDGGRLVAALAAEPGFARLAEAATPVLLWRPGDEVPSWASDGGRALLGRLPAAFDGTFRLPAATAARLRVLAGGLAPRKGFRLERLRWGRMEAPLVLACRLVPHAGEELLLTAILPPAATRSAAREEPRPAPIDVPDPLPREEVRAPVSRSRGRRFAWQADAEGRFTFVSPELAEIVGRRGADILGSRWEDLVGRLVEDPEGAVQRAFAGGEGLSRASVAWRDPDRERLVPVELSGAPASSAGGATLRGFGIARPDESRAIAPGAFEDLPVSDPPATEPSAPSPASEEATDPPALLDPPSPRTPFEMLRVWVGPQSTETPEAAGEAPRGQVPGEALTSSEQGALHEIARTLQNPKAEPSEAPSDRPTADIVQLPLARRRADPARLLDQLPIGAVVMRDGVPIYSNRLMLELLGFSDLPEAVAKGTLHGLSKLAPEDAASGTVSLRDAGSNMQTFDARVARVEWGESGADIALLTPPTGHPAAAHEALRLHLEARERRLEEATAALDLAADGVVTLDRTARLLSLNRSAERLFGVAANEVVGDSITALIEPRDHRVALACLDALRAGVTGAVQRCEIRGRTRVGGSIPLAMRAGRTPGEEQGFSVAFADITPFRAMEENLREARVAAEEASANQADFLARISHEVRTPLTAITGFAELMLDERFGPLGNERYKGYIRDIRDSGVHVISLVNDLLDLAKATSGSEELHPAPLDLNAVVQQCVALAGPLAGQEKTIIRTSFPSDLPRVFADERSVRQIVINLLSNAIRFTGAGGQVIVSTTSGGPGEIVLSIRDTGPGMSDEEVETALTPFRQVPKTRRGDGTGLGLPLSKALTEANGGVFVVTSARDLGTLVEVRLPVESRGAVAAE